jgi:hypothetical protein
VPPFGGYRKQCLYIDRVGKSTFSGTRPKIKLVEVEPTPESPLKQI